MVCFLLVADCKVPGSVKYIVGCLESRKRHQGDFVMIIILILFLAPLGLCLLNLLLNRYSRLHVHKTPFLAGFVIYLLWTPMFLLLCISENGFSLEGLLFDALYSSLFIFLLTFLNWFAFALTDASMHVQILMQIYQNPGITREDLLNKYNKDIILNNRVPRLLELGQLRLRDGRLFLSGRSVLFGARVCVAVRYILGLPLHPENARHET
ncbi:MAG: hypothetical protein D4R39_02270 [Methylophilaceae bacterium]|nr:MAG: hypothetical protein D4R39_02270 [Methylophilaceae bacterium]